MCPGLKDLFDKECMRLKIVNNDAYRYYNEMLKNYQQSDMSKGMDDGVNNAFVHSAICLANAGAPNPFEESEDARLLYFTMMKNYKKWRSLTVDRRVSRRRFLAAAADLAALQKENPFAYEIEPVLDPQGDTVSLDALIEEEYIRAEYEDLSTGTYIPVITPSHVFGVMPDGDTQEV